MDTTALAVSLIQCTDQVAQSSGHSGFIERQVISYLTDHPELTKQMLVKWQASNNIRIVNNAGFEIDFSK